MTENTFEQPLNERIRCFLRLQHLFSQADHHLQSSEIWDHRAVMLTLIEILSITSRTDLKTEFIKEIDRQFTLLSKIESNPHIDQERLQNLQSEIKQIRNGIYTLPTPIGQSLRKNELLANIIQRHAIPGGTCAFDLPAYHYWLQRNPENRIECLLKWLAIFDPLRKALNLLLGIIRSSANPAELTAKSGFFQQILNKERPTQIIRVSLSPAIPVFPEISGGKHRFTIRFLEPASQSRPLQTTQDIAFHLTCCVF